jgi:hypothetical protein
VDDILQQLNAAKPTQLISPRSAAGMNGAHMKKIMSRSFYVGGKKGGRVKTKMVFKSLRDNPLTPGEADAALEGLDK